MLLQFQPGQPILHAYILAAADERLRGEETLSLAAAMLCTSDGARPCGVCRDCRKVFRKTHPDVITVEPESSGRRAEMKVDQIRRIVSEAYIMPSEAQRKVYVLSRADTMNRSAQNALLKLLEEPPRSAAFILAAERAESLLPTVRSRCELIRRNTASDALPEEAVSEAGRFLSALAAGDRLAQLRWCLSHEKDETESVRLLLTALLRALLAHLADDQPIRGLSGADALAWSDRVQRCLEYLRSNVSVRHIMGCLSVPVNQNQN